VGQHLMVTFVHHSCLLLLNQVVNHLPLSLPSISLTLIVSCRTSPFLIGSLRKVVTRIQHSHVHLQKLLNLMTIMTWTLTLDPSSMMPTPHAHPCASPGWLRQDPHLTDMELLNACINTIDSSLPTFPTHDLL
jgi:hypothetical protein